MNAILEKYRNAKLRYRLLLPATALLLVVLFIGQVILYVFDMRMVRSQLYQSTETSAIRIQSYLDTELRSVIERVYHIKLDESVDLCLRQYLLGTDPAAEAAAVTQISRALSLHKASEPMISSLVIYTPKTMFTGGGMLLDNSFDFRSSQLYQQMKEENQTILFAPAQRDDIFISHRQVVPVLHRFYVEGYGEECVMVVNLDLMKLRSCLLDILPGDSGELLLADQDGRVVTSTSGPASAALAADGDLLERTLSQLETSEATLAADGWLLCSRSLEMAPWKLVYLQSTQQMDSQLSQIRRSFLVVTLLALTLLVLALNRIVDTVTLPLTRFCEHIRFSDSQEEPPDFFYPYQDEIGVLAENYNDMLHRIRSLLQEQSSYIHRLLEEKARADEEAELKRQAELRALQAQINPHFLYNTLDSIRWKAEKAGAEDISQMTTALATLFRVGLSRGREIIPLPDEISHVESYLKIQKERYQDRLSYSLDLPAETGELYTIKLILQPLVENAIYHGIKETERDGMVTVTGGVSGDKLWLRVADNGQGIPPESLKKLQADLARGKSVRDDGYGIFNVNERIRLYFGDAYGLTLESRWEEGTTATVCLPRIRREEAEEYVSRYDRG